MIILLLILAYLGIIVWTTKIAGRKHRSRVLWCIFGICFGIVALFLVACVGSRKDPAMRLCPACQTAVPRAASVCRYCHSPLVVLA